MACFYEQTKGSVYKIKNWLADSQTSNKVYMWHQGGKTKYGGYNMGSSNDPRFKGACNCASRTDMQL